MENKKVNIDVITAKRMEELGKVKLNNNFSTDHDNVIALEIVSFPVQQFVNGRFKVTDCKGVKVLFANKHSKLLKKVMLGKVASHSKADRLCTRIAEDGYISEKFNVWTDTKKATKEQLTLDRAVAFFATLCDDVTGKAMFKIVSPARLTKYQALVDEIIISRDSTIQSSVRSHLESCSKWTDKEVAELIKDYQIEQ